MPKTTKNKTAKVKTKKIEDIKKTIDKVIVNSARVARKEASTKTVRRKKAK